MRTPRENSSAPPGPARSRADRRPAARLLTAVGTAVAAALVALGALGALPAGAVTTTTAPTASGARPDSRATFGVEPASNGTSQVRSNFSFAATPGAIVNDNVAVVNFSSTPLTLQLYATDALETSGGGFGLLPAAATPTGVGSWIALPAGTSTVQVPAQTPAGPGLVVLPIAVHIPLKANPGDHAGGIVASLQTVGTNRNGDRVVLNQRVGTRVLIRVSGTLAPKLTVTGLHASYDGTLNPVGKGSVEVSYLVSNTGNADLAVAQSVKVAGAIADSRTAALPKIALLLPGSSVTEHVTVRGLWPQFLLHTSVTAQPLPVTGASLPALVTATSSTWLWAIPWSLIVIVIVLLAGYWWFRRRRRRAAAPAAAAPTPVPAAQPVGAGR